MIPTGTLDYSSYILKLRAVKPDLVYLNLAGTDQTTFLKQYREFGAPYELAGGVMDTSNFCCSASCSPSGSPGGRTSPQEVARAKPALGALRSDPR